jgi:hypothetical protein
MFDSLRSRHANSRVVGTGAPAPLDRDGGSWPAVSHEQGHGTQDDEQLQAALKTIEGLHQRLDGPLALAVLLDEIGACARGELALPDRDQLADWLRLLNEFAGSAGENN